MSTFPTENTEVDFPTDPTPMAPADELVQVDIRTVTPVKQPGDFLEEGDYVEVLLGSDNPTKAIGVVSRVDEFVTVSAYTQMGPQSWTPINVMIWQGSPE
jgi:hypothetical protein